MTTLEEKLAQLEQLRLERVRQEEERKAHEWLEAEQRAREQELEIGHGSEFRSEQPVPALRHGRRGEHHGWCPEDGG